MGYVPEALLKQALAALAKFNNNQVHAARFLKIARRTFIDRLDTAKRLGITLDGSAPQPAAPQAEDTIGFMHSQIRRMESELKSAKAAALDHAAVKRIIIGANDTIDTLTPPAWLNKKHTDKKIVSFGVPTLFVSDLHWGENVDRNQIGGVNEYNLEIASRRLKELSERAIHLLTILSPERKYDGIVVPLGGDMISGNIHDELIATNDCNTMPTVLDLFEQLCGFIGGMADTFGNVFLPCVTGNHGRDTRKIWSKDRHHTSFDWLLYMFLAKHFAKDTRVKFFIPDGPDAAYNIYDHRYLLTHGDQFRGGDGVIGVLGPVIRGDYKKRSRNAQVGLEYDTLLMGHFHQHIQLTKLIINGSLKGMDEYAWAGNFPYERPQQALWITHRKHGITYRMPVYVDQAKGKDKETRPWVSL